jgi:hypothetical protein
MTQFAIGTKTRFTITCSVSSDKRSVYVRVEEFYVKYSFEQSRT